MASRVPPVLRLAVLCEDIGADDEGRPYNLFVPVHTVWFSPGSAGSYTPPTPKLYLQLQGGVGTFYVHVALREHGEPAELYRTRRPFEVVFRGDEYRVIPLELAIDLDGLSFPRPGAYELLVRANYVDLHDPAGPVPIPFPPIRVTVLPADGSEGGVL